MASSSTSSIRKNYTYHVFLSFRGPDTRKKFTDHLYTKLTEQGIHTFRDSEELIKGRKIDDLFKAIEESKFYIIVFSKTFASSSWCMKELAKIMECQDMKEQIAYPVFYDVEPGDLRKQSGALRGALQKWLQALEDAGNTNGWVPKNIANGHESVVIGQIVKEISVKLRSIHLGNDENLVGMGRRIRELESTLGMGLNDDDDDVRMIGIRGMGGIGKTTLAKAVFDKVCVHFEGTSFVQNVRSVSKRDGGLLSLQQQVLSDVLKDESMHGVSDAISMMKLRLPYKKVLLLLDDVDSKGQLEELAGPWFKKGSRIIITTRNVQVLKAHTPVTRIHDVNLLSDEEAITLFSRYAFGKYIPEEGYEKLSFKLVRRAAGLPLTIKVLGSSLITKKIDIWKDAIKRLKLCKETLDRLEISYDGLEDDYKKMFLDVACFMKGLRKEDAIRILVSCGFSAIRGLDVLKDNSLITTSNQRLGMHDSIEELGWNIVRRLHSEDPSKHSRLWIREEIEALLSDDDVATEATTSIRLDQVNLTAQNVIKGLGKLKNLRVLLISGKEDELIDWKFEKTTQYFPNALRFLNWERYPFGSLPQTFRPDNLVGLELPCSKITQLWERGEEEKVLKNLRFLDLSDSLLRNLDLRLIPNIERLDLKGCHALTELHVAIGCLERLAYLNLIGCSNSIALSFIKRLESLKLLSLPKLEVTVESSNEIPRYSRNNLPELRFSCFYHEEHNDQKSVSLNLRPCTKLNSVSKSISGLHLKDLTFNGCIPEVPQDIDRLPCLENLTLLSTNIICLPDSICMLKHLKSLQLESCSLLEKLPEDIGRLECLEKLILKQCASLRDIPDSICKMKRLRYFHLPFCSQVHKLPEELGSLECLQELNIKHTQISHLPQTICSLKGLRIFGSETVLLSCVSAADIQTSETETFCYIKAVDDRTGLRSQFVEKFCQRWWWWWWWVLVVLMVVLAIHFGGRK